MKQAWSGYILIETDPLVTSKVQACQLRIKPAGCMLQAIIYTCLLKTCTSSTMASVRLQLSLYVSLDEPMEKQCRVLVRCKKYECENRSVGWQV